MTEVSHGEVLVDKGAMYIRVTLYCGHLIILRLFHLGRYPYFGVMAGLVWSYDPESYAGSSICYW